MKANTTTNKGIYLGTGINPFPALHAFATVTSGANKSFLSSLNGVVEISKEKFDNLPECDKVLLVKEEVIVTALERYLIPADFKYSQNLAYAKSLKKLLTTMAESGWFVRWMIFNYDKLWKNNDWSFITKFKTKFNYD